MADSATAEKEKSEKKHPAPTAEQVRLEELFGPLNPGDSIKVRRILTDQKTGRNRRSICVILTELQGVEDLERHIYDYGLEQGWQSGDYMAELCRPGVGGAVKYGFFSFDFPQNPAAAPTPNALEQLKQAKEILGEQPQASPDVMLKSVTEAMKIGADAAAAKQPAGDATATLLKPVLEAVVARLNQEPKAAPAPLDPVDVMDRMLQRMEKFGLIGQKGDAAKPVTEQVKEVRELVAALADLAGPAGPTPEPTAVAVAKIFAPYVPQVLHTINNVVDVVRLRLGALPGQPGGALGPPTRQVGPPPIPAAVQQFIAQTQTAIGRDDDGFFPAFAEGIAAHIVDGRTFLLGIQRGSIEEEPALVAVGGTGLLNVGEARTRAWLLRFVHWLRVAQPMAAGPAAAAAPPSAAPASEAAAHEVMGRCEKCQQEYRFDSLAEFHADTHICDNAGADGQLCAGNIGLVPEEGAA